jgi:predicted ATPase
MDIVVLLYGENGIGKSNFTRMFKRVTSLTPKNYREQGISDKLWDKPYFIRQT